MEIRELSLNEVAQATGFETVEEMIEEYAFESVVPACCSESCDVEPDGVCSHGHNSILLEYGTRGISMTQKAFIKVLDKEKYSYEIEGDRIVVTYKWSVHLESLKSLPSGVEFRNKGSVNLDSLTSIPPDVVFRNEGGVRLYALKSISPGVEFSNKGDVYLGFLKSLSPGVVFRNEGNVRLYALKSLPPGVEFSNKGNVYLGFL